MALCVFGSVQAVHKPFPILQETGADRSTYAACESIHDLHVPFPSVQWRVPGFVCAGLGTWCRPNIWLRKMRRRVRLQPQEGEPLPEWKEFYSRGESRKTFQTLPGACISGSWVCTCLFECQLSVCAYCFCTHAHVNAVEEAMFLGHHTSDTGIVRYANE